MELAEVVRRHGPAYVKKYGARMPRRQLRALEAIVRCHPPACGGSRYVCDACGQSHFAWHGWLARPPASLVPTATSARPPASFPSPHRHLGGHRACGQCGQRQALAWRDRQGARLLPVSYFLLTFTIPEELRPLFRRHPRLCYGLLFQESAAALREVAQPPRYLGRQLGALGVLHTWTRQLGYHPHVHYLVPGVALRADGTLCFPKDPAWRLPVQRLSARFRTRLRQRLRAEFPRLDRQVASRIWRQPWVVHCQPAGQGAQALSYLARYIYKTALSSTRLLEQNDQEVTFTYRDSQTREERTCTLRGREFLRRFLQHVLPKGFQRVRHYGWLSPAAKRSFAKRSFATVAALLGAVPVAPAPPPPVALLCPHCHQPLRRVAQLSRAPPWLQIRLLC